MSKIHATLRALIVRAGTARAAVARELPPRAADIRAGLTIAARRLRGARQCWLFLTELAGIVLVAFGISLWSTAAALIVGGLVLVAAIQMQPLSSKVADVPPPIELLRHQAENAATLINSERYGLAAVDADRLAQLSRHECEQLIIIARQLGANKT